MVLFDDEIIIVFFIVFWWREWQWQISSYHDCVRNLANFGVSSMITLTPMELDPWKGLVKICNISDFVLAATAENVDRDRIKEQVLLWRLQEKSPIDFFKVFIFRVLQLRHKSGTKESYQKWLLLNQFWYINGALCRWFCH